jgi:hypothetical protein
VDKDPADDGRTDRQFASIVVPAWARSALRFPGGRVPIMVLGWGLELLAAGAFVWSVVPQVVATVGRSGFTYAQGATVEHSAPGWLPSVGILGLLLGFNLIYWNAPPAQRARQMAYVVALNLFELVCLMVCVIWVTGAGYPAGAIFDLSTDSADGAVGATLLIGVALAAAGIMLWLGSSSTFDEQRDEYLDEGRTTVTTTSMSVRAHACWFGAILAGWLLLLIPMLLSNSGTNGYSNADVVRDLPWPRKATFYDDKLSDALTMYAVLLAVLWGLSGSMLIEKLLYRGPWADRAARSRKQARGAGWLPRFLVRFRHWPIVIAGFGLSIAAQAPPDPSVSRLSDLLPAGVLAVICLAVGLLLLRWEWKVRDLTDKSLKLHLALS